MAGRYDSFGLEGKKAIVTGASRGIGRALALGLAEAGADVALVSRTRSTLEEVAEEVEAKGRMGLVIPTDIQNVDDVRAMIDKVQGEFGKIDILVNNACWTDTTPALEVDEDEWDQTMGTCLKGTFFVSQAAARIMKEQGSGKIINIGSTFGKVTFKGRSVYAAAKAAVHHLTRALANEWACDGINVNGVGPCLTETETRKHLFKRPGFVEWATEQMLPCGRWAQPEDMVGAVLFLSSSLSDMVHGHVLMVDGGWTIH